MTRKSFIAFPLVALVLLLGVFVGRQIGSSFGSGGGAENYPLTSDPKEASDPRAVEPKGNWTVDDAKQFKDFALFWAGDEHAGVPLAAVIRASYPTYARPGIEAAENSVTFLYGACIPPEGEGGCPAPYQVVVQQACQSQPSTADESVVAGAPFDLKGATAQLYRDGHLEFWTQDVSVTVYGPDQAEMFALAGEIVPLNPVASLTGTGDFQEPTAVDGLKCPPLSPASIGRNP